MFGIGGGELILILLFAFLILGPEKLPDMAKTAGKAIARFRTAQKDMNETLKETGLVDARTGKPYTNPVDMVEKMAQVGAEGKASETVEKVVSGAAAAATAAVSPEQKEAGAPRSESFAQRKARYERERAAREAAKAAADEAAGDVADGAAGDAADDAAGDEVGVEVDAAADDNQPEGGDA